MVIVTLDAEADEGFEFAGLSNLMRKARLDFQTEITFSALDEMRRRKARHALGTAVYPPSADGRPLSTDPLHQAGDDWRGADGRPPPRKDASAPPAADDDGPSSNRFQDVDQDF